MKKNQLVFVIKVEYFHFTCSRIRVQDKSYTYALYSSAYKATLALDDIMSYLNAHGYEVISRTDITIFARSKRGNKRVFAEITSRLLL